MMELLLQNAFESWVENTNKRTLVTFKHILDPIIEEYGKYPVADVLTEGKLREFILSGSAVQKRHALIHLCRFVFIDMLGQKTYIFPQSLSIEMAKKYDSEHPDEMGAKKQISPLTYFPPNFNIQELLSNKYYDHIESPIAICTLKAIMSLCLSIPLGLEYITGEKKSDKYIRVNDVHIEENNEVTILSRNENSFVPEFRIDSKLSAYLIDYYKERLQSNDEEDAFFIKMWTWGSFKWDKQVQNTTPSSIHTAFLYILRYICTKLNYPIVTIDSLRNNVIYNWLITSKGTALDTIVSLCGIKQPFILDSYLQYRKFINSMSYGYDFFDFTSSHIEKEDVVDSDEEILMSTTLLTRRRRDTIESKKLKDEYNNTCQICGKKIVITQNVNYSEAHHIQPLGGKHRGPDDRTNMIVLCPNHHAMFDLGVIAIDPNDGVTILHIDKNDAISGKPVKQMKHNISSTYLRYHYQNIFLDAKKRFNIEKGGD